MYDELVKRLRICPDYNEGCVNCPHEHDLGCRTTTMHEAANAIEELSKLVNESIPKDDAEIIIAEVTKPRWIPVGERLPEEYVDVLCYCSRNGEYGCGAWHKEDKTIYWTGLDGMIPTHWMPLPPAPKEE